MARRSDLAKEISGVTDDERDEPRLSLVTGKGEGQTREDVTQKIAASASTGARAKRKQQRMEAMSFALAGLSWEQIGDRLDISPEAARELVNRNFERVEARHVEELRGLEMARLDRAQAAIWTRVLEGDDKAIASYLRISERRAKITGLDAPTRIDVSMTVREEMVNAFDKLEAMVLGNPPALSGDIIDGEVLEDDSDEGGVGRATSEPEGTDWISPE